MAKQNRRASQLAHLSFLRTTGKYKVRSQKITYLLLYALFYMLMKPFLLQS